MTELYTILELQGQALEIRINTSTRQMDLVATLKRELERFKRVLATPVLRQQLENRRYDGTIFHDTLEYINAKIDSGHAKVHDDYNLEEYVVKIIVIE